MIIKTTSLQNREEKNITIMVTFWQPDRNSFGKHVLGYFVIFLVDDNAIL